MDINLTDLIHNLESLSILPRNIRAEEDHNFIRGYFYCYYGMLQILKDMNLYPIKEPRKEYTIHYEPIPDEK